MRDLLTVDLAGVLDSAIRGDRHDGLLHPSTHLAGSLRHAQLDLAGAPKRERPFADQMTLQIGTLVHEFFHDALRTAGVPYMAEVGLGPWMPKGWNGTADAIVWNPDLRAFVLVDFKTTKGEALRFRKLSGASEDHILQTSIYWHALNKMGLPLAKAIGVLYIPKNPAGENTEPLMVDFDPIPWKTLVTRMNKRKKSVDGYLGTLPKPNPRPLTVDEFVTDDLAPESEMTQKLYADKSTGDQVLKLVPHYLTPYCPYEPPLCACSEQRAVTIGRFNDLGDYTPRKGYEEILPVVLPA
jgi:hypothetical protein